MSERVRRRTSKWDLKEDSQHFPVGMREDNSWTGRAAESNQDAVPNSEWHSSRATGANDPKRASWEPLPRNRGESRSVNARFDYNDGLRTGKAWDEDQSYCMSMSPGLDGGRERNRSRSPRGGSGRLKRSGSRSPSYSYRGEYEGRNEMSRIGSDASTPICKDFAAGRCRRGVHCRFLHHDNNNYEVRRQSGNFQGENWRNRHDREESFQFESTEEQAGPSQDEIYGQHENPYEGNWEKHGGLRKISAERCNNFLKGKCFRGSSCRYVHDADIADDPGARERGHYRRDRSTSFGHENRHEFNKTNDIPCKYFASGNCFRGTSCKFSHDVIAQDNLEGGRSRDERSYEMDVEKRPWHGSKWTDKTGDSYPGTTEGRSMQNILVNNVDKQDSLWGGRKWSDCPVDLDVNSPQQTNGNGGRNSSDNAEGRSLESSKWADEGVQSDVSNLSKRSDFDCEKVVNKSENVPLGDRKWKQEVIDLELSDSPQQIIHIDDKVDGTVSDSISSYYRWEHGSGAPGPSTGGPTWVDKPADQDDKKPSQFLGANNGPNIGRLDSHDHGVLLNEKNMLSAGTNIERTMQTNQELQFRSAEISLPNERIIPREVPGEQQHASTFSMKLSSTDADHIQLTSEHGNADGLSSKSDTVIKGSIKQPTEIPFFANSLAAKVPLHGQSFSSKTRDEIIQPLSSFIMNAIPSPSQAPRLQVFDLNEQVDTVHQPSSSPHHQTSLKEQMIKMQDMNDQKSSEVTSRHQISQSVVSSKQDAPITNISASLAQIFGNGQQLPQLYATLNSIPTGLVPSIANSTGQVVPAVASSFTNSNQVLESLKEYDPISDSIDMSNPNVKFQPQEYITNTTEHQEASQQLTSFKLSSSAGAVNGVDVSNSGSVAASANNESQVTKQLKPVADVAADEPNIKMLDTAYFDDADADADAQNDEEGKKKKDAKGMRMFKFALVESVKEILKPKWKEGQMSKEAHKTIVKKVVDKVTSTFNGAHVPQTQEKIDHYLSYSKPKLTKLVQAYVEKYLKT
ncbi:hypothetical protein Syun_004788 [Stephania yunnanensis]|uniref:C3H1-type domain-containing protein n=1 Tax=Stephania yunnanensis TaxID=152371 RepID=A0AAP0Q5A6_9MAGN